MFKHMKIGTRLLLAFGVVLAIMFGISGAGLWGAYSMSDNMLKMVSKDSKVISSSYAVQSDLLNLRRYEKDIFLNTGSSDKQAEYFGKWNNEHRDLVASLDSLEKNIENAKDRAAVVVMRKELAAYDAGFNKVYNAILLKDIKTPQEANKAIAEYKDATHKMEKSALDIAEAAGVQLKAEEKAISSLSDSIIWVLVVLSVVAIIITIIAAVTTMRRITVPLQSGVGIADEIAEGNLTVTDIDAGSNDELGFLAKSLNKMKNSLGDVIGQILGASDAVASASEELSATVQEIVKRVDDQAGRAGQVATSSTEMSQTVIDIARNVQDISQAAQKTVKIAEDGSGVVTKTIKEVQDIATTVTDASQIMGSLGEKSKQIGEIITVINDIADQTNLLALNAAIEAARAGEQGRGFAVVADEVRKLAERTTKATTEIAQMVTAIQDEAGRSVAAMNSSFERVQNGVALSKEAGASLRLILDSISDLRASVDHIATAMDEMSTASDGITENIEAIATVSRDTSDSSKEIQRASEELLNLSVSLNQIVGRFNIRSSERRINVKPKISVSALSPRGAEAV